jgi:hypothetical protein
MDVSKRFFSDTVAVKGRTSSSLTTYADASETNILTAQAVILATPSTLAISSSSINDDVAGTGALTIKLYGRGAGGIDQTETVVLTGRVVATTSKTWSRVFYAQVESVGSIGSNVGDIYIIKTGTGGTYTNGVPGTFTVASAIIKILATSNQGGVCFYTTPADSTGENLWRVKKINITSRVYSGTAIIQTQDTVNGTPVTREWYIGFAAGIPVVEDLTDYLIHAGPLTDIKVIVSTATAASEVNIGLTIERFKNVGIGA